jgi:hypothetical protein
MAQRYRFIARHFNNLDSMKTKLVLFIVAASLANAAAQSSGPVPDTLLIHTFEGELDPADTMLAQPSGFDVHWVNYDQDNKQGACVFNGPTPKGWYWESDLGTNNPSQASNFALTSCSFLNSANPQNRNWLITPPVHIPDDSYLLGWRSLSYYGPDYMDGYKVLVSTGSNLPGSFKDTLFVAAQTITSLNLGSLVLSDYIFSSGYIHANGYTDQDYFFVDFEGGQPFYHGKLEPHTASLAKYSGQTVYIAFLHDSFDDFQLQLDDILVSNPTVGAKEVPNVRRFALFPNPCAEGAYLHWELQKPQKTVLSARDLLGNVLFRKPFEDYADGRYYVETANWPAGTYICQIETPSGTASRLLFKL